MNMTTRLDYSQASYVADIGAKIDYLTTQGYVRALGGGGHGRRRAYVFADVYVARIMGALLDLGLKPATARSVAERLPLGTVLAGALADFGQPVKLPSDVMCYGVAYIVGGETPLITHGELFDVAPPVEPLKRMGMICMDNQKILADIARQRVSRVLEQKTGIKSFEETVAEIPAATITLHLYREAVVSVERALRVLGEIN